MFKIRSRAAIAREGFFPHWQVDRVVPFIFFWFLTKRVISRRVSMIGFARNRYRVGFGVVKLASLRIRSLVAIVNRPEDCGDDAPDAGQAAAGRRKEEALRSDFQVSPCQ